ncbi:hypothetical protein A0256_19920 [Mucilaginibacter sp. PAMC 26640]|nr:hypothetical protein A0256_19920 [Mucilaginibacter sp. PAMC 26640]
MPLLVLIKNRLYLQFILLTISIAIAILIAVTVPLQKDELGALVNIYLPILIGVVSLFIYGGISIISKNTSIRLISLTVFILLNIVIGIRLNLGFNSFNKNLSPSSSLNAKSSYSVGSPRQDVEITNLDGFTAANRAVFSYTFNPDLPVNNASTHNTIINHDVSRLRVKNKLGKNLTIYKPDFTANGLWTATVANSNTTFPLTLHPGDSLDLNITFTAKALNKRVESVWWKAVLKFQHAAVGFGRLYNYQIPYGSTCANISGKLMLATDNATKLQPIDLTGIWEYRYENDWEPGLQRILNSLNFKTKVGFTYFDNGLKGETTTKHSDEVAADYFEAANPTRPVKIRKIASYHGCCTTEDSDTLAIYDPNKQLTRQLQYTNQYSGQMLLPFASDLPDAKHLAKLSGPFAVKIGLSYTDRTLNHGKKIGIRIWKAIDDQGKVINNAYILGSDYLGKKGTNYDYQDNVYYIENIKLYNKSHAPLMAQK